MLIILRSNHKILEFEYLKILKKAIYNPNLHVKEPAKNLKYNIHKDTKSGFYMIYSQREFRNVMKTNFVV